MMSENRKDRSSRGFTVTESLAKENTSGWNPTRYTVLLRKDNVEEKTAGGIVITSDLRETEEWTVTTGVMVAMGSLAFTENGSPWEDRPVVGQRVRIKEYTGQRFIGDDGEKYLQVNDTDIIGVKA
jgi:co-chaperonin GroES (HSP10)